MSIQSFAELGVSTPVRNALAKRGITEPFAVQTLVIGDALAGLDVLVKSPTGSGKTLAFSAPIVEQLGLKAPPGAALIVAPTRELALQIAEELRPIASVRNLSVATVYGGAGIAKQAKLARRAQILVATPGRLLDLMERGAVTLKNTRILVLDEADRMLDMGFRPDVERIIRATPKDRQTMLFSATLDGEVSRIAKNYTVDPVRHEHVAPKSNVQVEHRFVGVTHEKRFDALLAELRSDRELALIFVRTKRGADRLVKKLGSNGIKAVAMHGNKSQGQRERALASFDSGRVDALVATDVAARGIDVDGISHVINFDPPGDCDAYQHRVGRTARAGRGGVGVTLVRREEAADVGKIADTLKLRREFAETGYAVPSHNGSSHRSSSRRGRRRR